MGETVLYDAADGVATLTLNRPDRLNTIVPELISDLRAGLERAWGQEEVHAIRLRGAWTVTADGGRYRHSRPFGWPAALDPHERVWLVIAGTATTDAVVLNGTPVDSEADITALLRPRNELALTRDGDDLSCEVTLEVRRADSAPV